LIKIELWQIEGSNPAPKFEIMVSPNEWAKAIKTSSSNGELTDTKLQQLEFWNKFKNYVRENDTRIRLQTPRPQHWYDVSMGSPDGHVALTINSRPHSSPDPSCRREESRGRAIPFPQKNSLPCRVQISFRDFHQKMFELRPKNTAFYNGSTEPF